MKKLLGITLFLAVLYVLLQLADPGARSAYNHFNLGKRIGLYGIITLGAGLLIISGGIDLSMGAVIGLCATLLPILLVEHQLPPWQAIPLVLAVGAAIGLINGLLITKLHLQAFVVTLCGLFVYRGLARWIAEDQNKGFGQQFTELRDLLFRLPVFELPRFLVILALLAALATVFLHFSVYGRYFYAIGSNEKAARYSGIAVDRYKILAYVLCSLSAAIFGILYVLELNSAQPSETGNFFELYAIAAAVLGGCSLRGGEGTVAGMLVGTAILWILPNFTNMWGVKQELQLTVIGAALLIGAMLDELLRRRGASATG
jgi:ribose transport system permease protein